MHYGLYSEQMRDSRSPPISAITDIRQPDLDYGCHMGSDDAVGIRDSLTVSRLKVREDERACLYRDRESRSQFDSMLSHHRTDDGEAS